MEVVNPRAALLSNFEVLTLLRELESDHLARSKAAIRIKKEEEANGTSNAVPGNIPMLETSENLRTVEVEAIQYLSADYLPTNQQSEQGIEKLTQDLAPYDLTKAEKLQIVNLAPTMEVELYVIVEELEDRIGEERHEILTHVEKSLVPTPTAGPTINGSMGDVVMEGSQHWEVSYDAFADGGVEENVFDDTGEGAGVEGDLDVEEDD
ncbi:HRDC-like protein [Crucibulum laeve]|uniref:DNA-directed RNA polymerase III subunit RPC9 n=1 Tax=Crucibulum laeve TaxID=68775 RepID=A0A5C3M704_9AGAR|nr:HRDC-like protein [Crucibulum laeve]